MGFFAAFLFSVLFSPIVMILVLQLTQPRGRERRDRSRPSTPAS